VVTYEEQIMTDNLPESIIIAGAGAIGVEFAYVMANYGTQVTIVEFLDRMVPLEEPEVSAELTKAYKKLGVTVLTGTKVETIDDSGDKVKVTVSPAKGGDSKVLEADKVMQAIGFAPRTDGYGLENTGVAIDEKGFIRIDGQRRTNVPHIYAIGDICGEPMLAHKASHEAKVAAEVIAGHKAYFDARTIPSVAYTDPEIAWMGLTEAQAQAEGREYDKAVFPWAASGRALATGREDGMTKLLFDKSTRQLLGAAIVGVNAGELISETVLALEMGADAGDIGLTVHPHPTLSETVFFASEMAEGSITDLYVPKR